MSYFGPVEIINKKVLGKKLLYLVVNDSMKRWIDYEQLTEYLPQVIEFEKRQNFSFNEKKNRLESKEKFVQEKAQFSRKFFDEEESEKSDIKYLEFVDIVGFDDETKEKIILFKAFHNNGKSEFMTNAEIKAIDPHLLIKFYEGQIKSKK